jgi:hypothetical protein
MPRLDIGGTKIDVSDDFLKLSPQAQDAFVKNTIMQSPEFQAAQQKTAQPDPGQGITIRPISDTPSPDDHGLAERQKLSPLAKAVNPITSYPETYNKMNLEAQQQVRQGLGQLAEGWQQGMQGRDGSLAGLGTFAKGALNTGLGALGYGFSPINAAYRSLLGQPVEDVTGIPREYTEFAAQLATPGIGLTGKVPEAMPPRRALMSEEPPPTAPVAPPPTPKQAVAAEADAQQMETLQAAKRLQEGYNPDLAVPRAVTTQNWLEQQAGQIASKVPIVGAPVGKAIEAVPVELGKARSAIADQFGVNRTAENVGADIQAHVRGAADAETKAAEEAARQADEAAQANWEQTNQARQQAIEGYQAQSARETGQQVGDVAPTDTGNTIIDTVRANHDALAERKNNLYSDAGSREGTVYDGAVGNADRFVRRDLQTERGGPGNVETTPNLTPAGMDMRQSLEAFSERARQRQLAAQQEAIDGGGAASDAARTGVPLRMIEQQRKTLGVLARGAKTAEDRRAASRIMDSFDEWQQRAMQGQHYEGDPDALNAFQRARAANRDLMQRFGYNKGNDANPIINKMVRGEPGEHIGANEVAKILTGSPDKAGRLLDGIFAATGDHPNHPNVVQAIRGGFWNHLAGTVEGSEKVRAPAQIQDNIFKFTRGPGREVAARIFTPQDQALMERHANVLTAAERARDNSAALAKANKPVPTEIQKGPMQELADRVLGRGEKPHEALYNTIESYAKSRSAGDTKKLADLMNNIPPGLKADFANTFIRRLGVGVKDEFSANNFVKEWGEHVSPGAKAVLLGNTGHVAALDDIATVSKKFDEVQRRFGNPSGSGQVVNFGKTAALVAGALAGTLIAPLKAIGGLYGTYKVSQMLARPQTAASIARLSRQMQRLQEVPSTANAAATSLAMRNLRNTALALGIHENQK